MQKRLLWLLVLLLSLTAIASGAPNFANFTSISARNQAFIDFVLTQVQSVNQEILTTRIKIKNLQAKATLSAAEVHWLQQVASHYNVDDFNPKLKRDWQRLLQRVDIIPSSLALAQAANESAWGTSRFATQGSNYYGLWCHEPGCGLVPRQRLKSQSHEVQVFADAYASTKAYIHFLNTHPAFIKLRQLRQAVRAEKAALTGQDLVVGLTPYSGLGREYVTIIQAMIENYGFGRFDQMGS